MFLISGCWLLIPGSWLASKRETSNQQLFSDHCFKPVAEIIIFQQIFQFRKII